MFQVKFFEYAYGLLLSAILFVFPFASVEISGRWMIFIFCVLIAQFLFMYFLKRKRIDLSMVGVFYAILFIIVFSFTDKVNFSLQFNLDIGNEMRIPFSTILLALAMVAFIIKVLLERKIELAGHRFTRYVFVAFSFLFVLMVIFYFVLKLFYPITLGGVKMLLNNILKYSMLILLTVNFLSSGERLQKVNLAFISSLSITLILSLIL